MAVVARAEELGKAELKPDLGFDRIFEEGQQAFGSGDSLHDCAWTAGEQQDNWIKGWLLAKQLEAGQ